MEEAILEYLANSLRVSVVVFVAAIASYPEPGLAEELPVGDGKVSKTPVNGFVFSCTQDFYGSGARGTGPWIHDTTWNPAEKPRVQGRVMWPNSAFAVTIKGNVMMFEGNGLPVSEPTGIFPIGPTDPAYEFDTNPNEITEQQITLEIPLHPAKASQPNCLPMGMIGVTTIGVPLYNALDDAGRDAAAHEIQDACDGHPQDRGQYHYHSGPACVPGMDKNTLVGWALDGFPILGNADANGKRLTNADLDSCHGRGETVNIEGRTYAYAYRITPEYPYTLGCFAGQVD